MARQEIERLRDKFMKADQAFQQQVMIDEEKFANRHLELQKAKQAEHEQLKAGLMQTILKHHYPERVRQQKLEEFEQNLNDLEAKLNERQAQLDQQRADIEKASN